jgi:hypothetical protein
MTTFEKQSLVNTPNNLELQTLIIEIISLPIEMYFPK